VGASLFLKFRAVPFYRIGLHTAGLFALLVFLHYAIFFIVLAIGLWFGLLFLCLNKKRKTRERGFAGCPAVPI